LARSKPGRSSPDQASLDEIIHALYLRAKFDRGEEEIRKGQGISHEEAKKKLQKWFR
jgi:predicted transcriptional regulator